MKSAHTQWPMRGVTVLMLVATAALLTAASPPKGPAKTEKKAGKATEGGGNTVVVDGVKYAVPAGPAEGSANALLLKKFDLNGDGKIDEGEIAAAQAAANTNRAPSFSQAADERRLTVKDLYEGGDPARRRATSKISSDDLLSQYDLNKDGKLDAAEFERLKRDIVKGGGQRELRPDQPPAAPPKPMPVVKEPLR